MLQIRGIFIPGIFLIRVNHNPNISVYYKSCCNTPIQFHDVYIFRLIPARLLTVCVAMSPDTAYYSPCIASITLANKSSGTFAKDNPGFVSVSILPEISWICLFDHCSGARLHNAKIIAVGFGAAFLWINVFFSPKTLPVLSVVVSVLVSSYS